VGKLKAIWRLVRLEHGLMFGLAVFIGGVVAGNIDESIAIAILVAIFLEIASFSLNDYFDIDIDKKNRRTDRPLATGEISPRTAIAISIIFFPLGIFAAYAINTACFLIALISAVFAILYDARLKRIKVIGNFYIAYTMAIPFIFGAAASASRITPIIYFLSMIAFLSGVAREIMKDVMDFEGDSMLGTRSFPAYFGKKGASIMASFLYVVACILAFTPLFVEIDTRYFHDYAYGISVGIADVIFFYISFKIATHFDVETMKKCRNYSLVAIFVGLIAFLLPVIM